MRWRGPAPWWKQVLRHIRRNPTHWINIYHDLAGDLHVECDTCAWRADGLP